MSETIGQEPEYRDPFAPIPNAVREWVEMDDNGATYAMAEMPDGTQIYQLLPLPANNEGARASKKTRKEEAAKIDIKVLKDIGRRFVAASVYAIDKDKGRLYFEAYKQYKNGMSQEEFAVIHTDTVSYLNTKNANQLSVYDERELLAKASLFASIRNSEKREVEVEDYIIGITGEVDFEESLRRD